MKVIKKISITITLIMLILTSLGGKVSAISQEQAGSAIATAARGYMDVYGAETKYSTANYNRGQTVFYQKKTDGNQGNAYYLDCASYAQLACIRGIHLDRIHPQLNDPSGAYTGFDPSATTPQGQIDIPPFEVVEGGVNSAKQGDIIMTRHANGNGHVMIYTGSGMVIHCDGRGSGQGKGGISWEQLSDYASAWGENLDNYTVYRISKESAEKLDENDIGAVPDAGDIINKIPEIINKWRYTKVPFREVPESSIEKDKTFSYQGIAKEEPKSANNDQNKDSSGQDNSGGWFFSKLSDLLKVIVDIIATIIKGVFVGFTTTVQILLTKLVNEAAGQPTEEWLKDGLMPTLEKLVSEMTSGGIDRALTTALSMGKIVYNQVPMLDPNVFNGNVAGGQTLNDSNLVITIRNLVATIYMAIRKVSIIGLLLVLIYLGIKLAITSSAEEKAECKQKIQGWFIAFFIVFGIHYFLVFVMQINEIIVGVLRSIGEGISNTYRADKCTT